MNDTVRALTSSHALLPAIYLVLVPVACGLAALLWPGSPLLTLVMVQGLLFAPALISAFGRGERPRAGWLLLLSVALAAAFSSLLADPETLERARIAGPRADLAVAGVLAEQPGVVVAGLLLSLLLCVHLGYRDARGWAIFAAGSALTASAVLYTSASRCAFEDRVTPAGVAVFAALVGALLYVQVVLPLVLLGCGAGAWMRRRRLGHREPAAEPLPGDTRV